MLQLLSYGLMAMLVVYAAGIGLVVLRKRNEKAAMNAGPTITDFIAATPMAKTYRSPLPIIRHVA